MFLKENILIFYEKGTWKQKFLRQEETMTEKKELLNRDIDILSLSNELTYHRYLLNHGQVRDFFQKMSIPEYIALHEIDADRDTSDIYSGRTYLRELSEKMQISMRKTSDMIGKLRDRGLVVWSHDGIGSEGTYVTITESGQKLLGEQEEILKNFYGRVIETYGKENMLQLLHMMKQLETVMGSAVEDMEGVTDDGEDTE